MAVIDGVFETKGTQLFFNDIFTTTDPTVTKLTCPTGISGVNGGTADRIDITCLDVTGRFRHYIGGFADPQELSIPFVLHKGDGSHQALFEAASAGTIVSWMVGLSDSASVPTIDSDGELVYPEDRTTVEFNAYVANVTLDMVTNEAVRGTLTLQPSGATTPHWAA